MVAFGSLNMIVGYRSINPAGSHYFPSRHRCALAQSRPLLVLALEIAPAERATADRQRAPPIDPPDGESALGRATPPRRTAQARGLRSCLDQHHGKSDGQMGFRCIQTAAHRRHWTACLNQIPEGREGRRKGNPAHAPDLNELERLRSTGTEMERVGRRSTAQQRY